MGTNYYVTPDPCPTCGRGETLHIGKASAGWKFGFAQYDEPELRTAAQWFAYLQAPGREIHNEYGERILADDLAKMIRDRQDEKRGGTANYYERFDPEGYRFITSDADAWS